ncbi:YggT family protein [bacterium]|jgi:YggT family protein|nr:YggT family protein [bacterium]
MLSWIDPLLTLYGFCLMLRIILSWLPELRKYALASWIEKITDPYLLFFKKQIPPIGGILDLSPLFALFLLQGLQTFLRHFL